MNYTQLWNKIIEDASAGEASVELEVIDFEYCVWFHNELKQSGISSYTAQSGGIYYINVLLC